jgi:hypothetical protein
MSANFYLILVILSVFILSLITILYNTYIFKRDIEDVKQIETFANTAKNETLSTHQVTYPKSNDYKEDDTQPLVKFRYIKHSTIENLETDLSEMFYVSCIQFYSISLNDIHQKIADDLNKTAIKTHGEFVSGPVYSIVSKDNTDCYSDDLIDVGSNKQLTTVYVLYPQYYNVDGKILQYKNKTGSANFKKYFDQKIATNMSNDLEVIYKLNNKNKLFYNLN